MYLFSRIKEKHLEICISGAFFGDYWLQPCNLDHVDCFYILLQETKLIRLSSLLVIVYHLSAYATIWRDQSTLITPLLPGFHGSRPALIISVDLFNYGPAGLVVAIPLTTRDKGIPFHVKIVPPEGGVKSTSFIKCEDLRSIGKERLIEKWGAILPESIAAVEMRLKILLGL
ncbi:type II toxin-antitoxin system PemK/MazF family toxin [Moorella naiadis]|uniref:type II toxin-antitoxin system PemK/MazF family toxin n=1 Tax=Moorella naiadis (nom. illeg.) TaxID=3093670 RepID=UPI003D9CB226